MQFEKVDTKRYLFACRFFVIKGYVTQFTSMGKYLVLS